MELGADGAHTGTPVPIAPWAGDVDGGKYGGQASPAIHGVRLL